MPSSVPCSSSIGGEPGRPTAAALALVAREDHCGADAASKQHELLRGTRPRSRRRRNGRRLRLRWRHVSASPPPGDAGPRRDRLEMTNDTSRAWLSMSACVGGPGEDPARQREVGRGDDEALGGEVAGELVVCRPPRCRSRARRPRAGTRRPPRRHPRSHRRPRYRPPGTAARPAACGLLVAGVVAERVVGRLGVLSVIAATPTAYGGPAAPAGGAVAGAGTGASSWVRSSGGPSSVVRAPGGATTAVSTAPTTGRRTSRAYSAIAPTPDDHDQPPRHATDRDQVRRRRAASHAAAVTADHDARAP